MAKEVDGSNASYFALSFVVLWVPSQIGSWLRVIDIAAVVLYLSSRDRMVACRGGRGHFDWG